MISQYQIIQRNVKCAVGGGKIYVIFIKGLKKVWCGYVCCGGFKVKLVIKRCIFNHSNLRGFTSISLLAFLPLDTLLTSISFIALFALRSSITLIPFRPLNTLFSLRTFWTLRSGNTLFSLRSGTATVALYALWT